MKQKQKNVALIGMTIALAIVITALFAMNRPAEVLFSAVVRYKDGERTITSWENSEGEIYIFLPAGVEKEDVQLVKQTQAEILIDGLILENRMSANIFSQNTPYELMYDSFGKMVHKTVTFVQSANVATLYISTESGRTEYLHEDKKNKEAGFVSLYTSDGQLNYQGEAESISGRGNYTWENSDKKPYNIELFQEADLLNMGFGRKWVLLANAHDSTLMRNKIVYDFANQIGMAYTPESQWVALYLNGEYRGLYLLCEAVEIGTDRIDISQETGMILAVETEDAFQNGKDAYFLTDADIAVGIKSPKNTSGEKLAMVENKVQSVENAILARDSVNSLTSNNLEDLIDVDSWVKKYLIEEIFGNHDALMRSAYYYYLDSSSRLFAGPVWDYDLSMGNEYTWQLQNPQAFWANRTASQPGVEMPWFSALYQKDIFYDLLVEVYRDEFLPELDHMINVTIPEYAQKIAKAVAIDKRRWNDDTELDQYVRELCTYLEQRVDFLSDVWLNQREYSVVRAVQQWGGYYAHYVVFKGDTLTNLPEFESTDTQVFLGWYNEKTGESFDTNQPITEDIEIYAKWQDKPTKKLNQLLKLVPLGVIAVMGLGLLWVEVKRWKKSR